MWTLQTPLPVTNYDYYYYSVVNVYVFEKQHRQQLKEQAQ